MVIRWKSDVEKSVVTANFERRGWEQCDVYDDDWDIFWASVGSAKQVFGSDSGTRLLPGQLINHFPNHYELTRKDLMVKNLKRFQKLARREGGAQAAEDLDIIPATFVLPQDYALFVEEFKRQPDTTWIMKPSSKSQGKGIFLCRKLQQVKKWSANCMPPALRNSQDSYVVSRYLDRPLLISGKKFDLRLYVCVTSYKPLTAYLSNLGFARFCSEKYTTDQMELDNPYIHLTNVAIQKHGDEYNDKHGNKWGLDCLRLYLESTRGLEATDQLFKDMDACVVKSLRAVQGIMVNDKHCFELYGYDLLIDDALKPWLIEVNASPSLSTTNMADRLLKFKVISDVLSLVTPLDWCMPGGSDTEAGAALAARELKAGLDLMASSGPRERVGSFRLIFNEQAEQDAAKLRRSMSDTHGHAPLAWYAGGTGARRSASAQRSGVGDPGQHLSATIARPRSALPSYH
ncbi:putative tubulin polyglutamylase TTLL1-like protein [Haematococcus lacustris]